MPSSRVPLTSHAHLSHPQEHESSSTKNPPIAKLGPRMARMDGTLAQPSTITNAIASGYHELTPNESLTQSRSSQKPSHSPSLPTKTPRSKLLGNLPTPYNNPIFADHSPNSMTTTSRHCANSAKSFTPSLRGWETLLRGWTQLSTNRCHRYFRSHQCPTLPQLLFNPPRNFL